MSATTVGDYIVECGWVAGACCRRRCVVAVLDRVLIGINPSTGVCACALVLFGQGRGRSAPQHACTSCPDARVPRCVLLRGPIGTSHHLSHTDALWHGQLDKLGLLAAAGAYFLLFVISNQVTSPDL